MRRRTDAPPAAPASHPGESAQARVAPVSAVVVDAVTRRYRRGSETVTAVDDVSFELPPARMTALVGPSGSGKTTLINLLIGADRPDRGEVRGLPARVGWASIAFVPQQLGLLPELTIHENVSLPTRLHTGRAGDADVDGLLCTMRIDELADRFPAETSLGQQQRAAIARALVATPSILVVDEPTSHQDEANVIVVGDALAATAAHGSVVLVATHDARLVARADRTVHLRDGRVVDEAAHEE